MAGAIQLFHWREEDGPVTVTRLRAALVAIGLEPYEHLQQPGTLSTIHTLRQHEVHWIVEGRLVIESGYVSLELGPGDRMEVPADTPYSTRVVSEEPVLTLRAVRP